VNREAATERVLILAPTGRDAELSSRALREAGLTPFVCTRIEQLCDELLIGAGTALITEEVLSSDAMQCLREALEKQEPWSDFPLIIFTYQPSAELTTRSFERLGSRANVTLFERPIRVKTMISAIAAALRARRRQYEVRDLLDELGRRVEERDHFLAMLSHELRNPLAAITLAADELDAQGEPSHERAVIVRQTHHLKQLVDDLLDISRVTSGKIVLHKATIDIGDVAEHCVTALRPAADARQMRMELHLPDKPVHVFADAVRYEQIVNNLLSNAIKYTPPGGSIDVTVESEGGDGLLRVRDTGKGIAPEMLTRIFELFMQGDVTIDRSEGGMGIGLTLVKRLTEMHGGQVSAYSEGRGSGSEFIVRLPQVDTKPAAKPIPERVSTAPHKPHHIVIIEDNADIRDLLRVKLKNLGHDVDAAEDGLRGLEKILEAKPDIALVDIGLPGIDGYEVARRTREALGPHVYLIALTGYGQNEDKKRALEAGFDVHLTKPADFVDLQNVLGRAPERVA
jgi:signal transduction histidine kinase/ActR/RegA family two-component response regulator